MDPNPEKYNPASELEHIIPLILYREGDRRRSGADFSVLTAFRVMFMRKQEFEPAYSTEILPALQKLSEPFTALKKAYPSLHEMIEGCEDIPQFNASQSRMAQQYTEVATRVLRPLLIPFLTKLTRTANKINGAKRQNKRATR